MSTRFYILQDQGMDDIHNTLGPVLKQICEPFPPTHLSILSNPNLPVGIPGAVN